MPQPIRFMNELFRIVNGALRLDVDKVRNYTNFLADKLEEDGDADSARHLRKMLAETDLQLRPATATFPRALPVDAESRFPLIERVNIRGLREAPLFLVQDQWDVVNEFLSIAKSYGQTETQTLPSSLSFLMYGPPGTGKSRLARFIAQDLGLDLYVARLDGLISSFLGSTSKNIRALFDFAAKTPCVLFLDEFDAIAKLRGDAQELGELKRVVNSFIQNLDALGPQAIVLAATNHEGLLDAAIWRRFSYRLELRLPDRNLRDQMWSAFLPPLQFKDKERDLLIDLTDGFSGSDIREVCVRLHRRHASERTMPGLKDAFQVIQNIAIGDREATRFVTSLKGKDLAETKRILRQRDAKLYSLSALAEMSGVSKATIHRQTVKQARPG